MGKWQLPDGLYSLVWNVNWVGLTVRRLGSSQEQLNLTSWNQSILNPCRRKVKSLINKPIVVILLISYAIWIWIWISKLSSSIPPPKTGSFTSTTSDESSTLASQSFMRSSRDSMGTLSMQIISWWVKKGEPVINGSDLWFSWFWLLIRDLLLISHVHLHVHTQALIYRSEGKVQESLDRLQVCHQLEPTNAETVRQIARSL